MAPVMTDDDRAWNAIDLKERHLVPGATVFPLPLATQMELGVLVDNAAGWADHMCHVQEFVNTAAPLQGTRNGIDVVGIARLPERAQRVVDSFALDRSGVGEVVRGQVRFRKDDYS